MNNFSRITAIVLIILAIVLLVSAVVVGVGGLARSGLRARSLGQAATAVRLVMVLVLFVQSLMLLAAGEGLYLLTNLTRDTQRN